MKNVAKILKELLTNATKQSSIDSLGEEELLALLQGLLSGFGDEELSEVHKNIKPFQSYIDRVVEKVASKRQDEVNERLKVKEQELEKLKSSVPRPTSSSAIKERMEAEKDPAERRFLQLEYQNAIAQEKLSEITAEKERIETESKKTAMLNSLQKIVSDKGLNVPDPSVFLPFGEQAEEQIMSYSEKVQKMIDEKINGIAKEKFGSTPPQGGSTEQKAKLTLEQIGQIANKDQRMAALKEIGY